MAKSISRTNGYASVNKRNEELMFRENGVDHHDNKAVWANQVQQRNLKQSMARLDLEQSYSSTYLRQRRMSSQVQLRKLQLQREATLVAPTIDTVIKSRIEKREKKKEQNLRQSQTKHRFSSPTGSSEKGEVSDAVKKREIDIMTPERIRLMASSRAGRERSSWQLKSMVDVEKNYQMELEKKRQRENEEKKANFQQYRKQESEKMDDKVKAFLTRVDPKRRPSVAGQTSRRLSTVTMERRSSIVNNERKVVSVQKERRNSIVNTQRRPSVSGRKQGQVTWQRKMSVVDFK